MPGFDVNRIVGLDSKYGKTLECAICLLILDNPIITDCGHNYCYECLKYFVENGSDGCPKCRKRFAMKISSRSANEDNCVIIQRNRQIYVFVRNLTLSEIISKLKINCDFGFNGCQKSLEVGLLSAHLKECEHRVCKKCGFQLASGKVDEHNCVELLKNAINEWKIRFEESEGRVKGLKLENSKLRTDVHKSNNECNDLRAKCRKYERMIDEKKKKTNSEESKGLLRRTLSMLATKKPLVVALNETKDSKTETSGVVVAEDQKPGELPFDDKSEDAIDSEESPVYVNLPDDYEQSSSVGPLVSIDMSVSVWIK